MDGNYFLIKLVKKRPILWDKSCQDARDSESRNVAWKEIAGTIGVEMNWIRSRWYNLRERFVKDLKQSYHDKQESKFKYFKEMLFLLKHVEFRKKPDGQFDSFVKQLPLKSKKLQSDKDSEFVITRKEIEESDDVDPDLIFMELTDDSGDVKTEQKVSNCTENENQIYIQEVCDSTASEAKTDAIKIYERNEMEGAEVIEEYEESNSSTQKRECILTHQEIRCEDTIFGELVTAMLKKMDENKKKSVKKEIINILLS